MFTYVDWVFGVLSGSMGWIWALGAALGTLAVAGGLSRTARLPGGNGTAALFIGGLVLSGALASPFLLIASRSKGPLGPYQVQQAILTLKPMVGNGSATPIPVQIWLPVTGTAGSAIKLNSCKEFQSLPLADSGGPKRVVLYMPHLAGRRDDNSARLSYLTSYGYIVVAFDDIAMDDIPTDATREDEDVRLLTWRLSTKEEYDRTVALNEIRAKREAVKALSGLDRLSACATQGAASPWRTSVDYRHVGFLGFSSGGSAAAEAATLDDRIAAVVNLDGNLFGQAFAGHLAAPYLFVMSDRQIPTAKSALSEKPDERYVQRLAALDLPRQALLAARPGSIAVRLKGSVHASFSDAVLEPHASRFWLFNNPIAIYNAVNLYTRDFFDVHLKGQSPALIGERTSKLPLAQTFTELGVTPEGE